jgi:hypothetical protein
MKPASSRLTSLLVAALAFGGLSTAFAENATRAPVVIQRPPVQDGSTASRTPFLAERPHNDAKPADGQAIDPDLPPNTPSTTQPTPPPPTVAVRQRPQDPALTPTGPSTLAVTVDAVRVSPGIRSLTYESRDTMLGDLDNRIEGSIKTINDNRDIMRDMAAATRDQFKDAIEQVELRERALRKSLKDAKKADATEWDAARTELAANYDSFAAAAQTFDNVLASHNPTPTN